jgi:hypothetical protein
VSVYLSVAPPDGFTKWGDTDWEKWLKDHPWEQAERVCARGDWAIFLFQVRQHCPKAKKALEPLLEQLVNERPLSAQDTDDLRAGLDVARDELDAKPAGAMKQGGSNFASPDDLEAMIVAARTRLGKEPSLGDVWAEVFDHLDHVLENAIHQKRGVYFGNV